MPLPIELVCFFNVVSYLGHQRQPYGVGTRPSTFVSVPTYTQYHGVQPVRSQESTSGQRVPCLEWNSSSLTVFTRAPKCSLPRGKWIQLPPLHHLCLRFILPSSCVHVAFQVLSSLFDFCMLHASPISLFDNLSDRRWRVHITKFPIRPVQFSSSSC